MERAFEHHAVLKVSRGPTSRRVAPGESLRKLWRDVFSGSNVSAISQHSRASSSVLSVVPGLSSTM